MNEFQNIWEDIKNRNFIEAYAVLFVSIVILLISIFGSADKFLSEIILASLSVLIYLNIKERREYKQLTKSQDIEGISAFHTGRHSMPKFDEVLKMAKKEIVLFAVKHSVIVHQYLGLLREKAESGCKVKILMLAARDDSGNINPNVYDINKQRKQSELLPSLDANTKALKEWYSALDASTQANVEIRAYWENPTVTFTFIDKDEVDGWLMVEVFIPTVSLFDLPHYIIQRRENEKSFKTHQDSFLGVWNGSKIISIQ